MAPVCLDRQIFYSPGVTAGCSRLPPPPLPPPPPPLPPFPPPLPTPAGKSQDDTILILGDSESDDDLDDDRSDASFPPLEELLAAACNKVKSGSVVSAGKSIDAAPDESDAPEPFSSSPETLQATRATFGPGPASAADNTSRDTTVPEMDPASLAEHGATHYGHRTQHSSRPSEKPSGTTSNHDGSICLDSEEWDRRFPFSHEALRRRLQARHAAKSAHNPAEPDQSQSILDPLCQSQGLRRAAFSHGSELQQTSDSCSLFLRHNYRGGSDQTSNPERHHPVPDDRREQSGRARTSRCRATPSAVREPKRRCLQSGDTEPSMQPSTSQKRVDLQHNIGRRRRRRRCDTNDEVDCPPTVGSDVKQGNDEDVVRPPRAKRRRVNTSASTTRRTAPMRQARLRCTNSSLLARRPPPTQGPKRRQSRRNISKPQPTTGSALEEETLGAAFASFEEWPLEAVLKRVWVDGAATFQVEFTWNPCTNHGHNDRAPKSSRRKSPAGRISSAARALGCLHD
ncbi:hypothetical protein C8A05DRAFT_46630 [Staphylotrichum tortipilum]|uniref:Uncharacterized protein n=1 Tax=Staphylotrichum tortipilum TaxID=2831512 RepID=A0AAN6RR98_9PEZI|nr:hypothetical protein C8A05DRAFT_46630 [Staphylotrichum longicolle]